MKQGTLVYICQHFWETCCLHLLVEKCYGENNVHDMEKGQQKTAAKREIWDSSPDKASTDILRKKRCMSEMLAPMYQTTQHHNTEDCICLIMTQTTTR